MPIVPYTVIPYKQAYPSIPVECYIAPGAAIIGDVIIGPRCSVWFNAVIRGDVAPITIGRDVNVQDGAIVHADTNHPTVIGDSVTIGHGAVVHGAIVGDNCLIGMNATVLSGVIIGAGSLIGAGAVVNNMIVPPNSLVIGVPAKVVRAVTEQERQQMRDGAQHYIDMSEEYRTSHGPPKGE